MSAQVKFILCTINIIVDTKKVIIFWYMSAVQVLFSEFDVLYFVLQIAELQSMVNETKNMIIYEKYGKKGVVLFCTKFSPLTCIGSLFCKTAISLWT